MKAVTPPLCEVTTTLRHRGHHHPDLRSRFFAIAEKREHDPSGDHSGALELLRAGICRLCCHIGTTQTCETFSPLFVFLHFRFTYGVSDAEPSGEIRGALTLAISLDPRVSILAVFRAGRGIGFCDADGPCGNGNGKQEVQHD